MAARPTSTQSVAATGQALAAADPLATSSTGAPIAELAEQIRETSKRAIDIDLDDDLDDGSEPRDIVPTTPRAFTIAALVLSFFEAVFAIMHPEKVSVAGAHLGAGDLSTAVAIVATLTHGLEHTAKVVVLVHFGCRLLRLTDVMSYAVGGAVVFGLLAGVQFTLGKALPGSDLYTLGQIFGNHGPEHGWAAELAAGAIGGFFYRTVAGVTPGWMRKDRSAKKKRRRASDPAADEELKRQASLVGAWGEDGPLSEGDNPTRVYFTHWKLLLLIPGFALVLMGLLAFQRPQLIWFHFLNDTYLFTTQMRHVAGCLVIASGFVLPIHLIGLHVLNFLRTPKYISFIVVGGIAAYGFDFYWSLQPPARVDTGVTYVTLSNQPLFGWTMDALLGALAGFFYRYGAGKGVDPKTLIKDMEINSAMEQRKKIRQAQRQELEQARALAAQISRANEIMELRLQAAQGGRQPVQLEASDLALPPSKEKVAS